jgi:hypothetical protein
MIPVMADLSSTDSRRRLDCDNGSTGIGSRLLLERARAGNCLSVESAIGSKQGFQEPIRSANRFALTFAQQQEGHMDSIIYLVGLVVVIMAILSFLGLR